MSNLAYEVVTKRIIELLEQGVTPWRRPWKNGKPVGGAVNWNTGRQYNGINQMLLGWSGEWATFKQVKDAGGKVKKGEKSQTVIFFTKIEKENEEGKTEMIPVYRLYNVFEINTQCEGLTSKRIAQPIEEEGEELNPIEAAEAIVKGFMNIPDIVYKSGEAIYEPFFDRVSVPPLADYKKPEEFYCTLFHELAHSTGHQSRLNRQFGKKFGDGPYSREELVAEMTAAMLCGVAGIEQVTIENSAAYLQNWLNALKEDSRMIVVAANAAQKAADYILGKPADMVQAS